MTHADPQRSPQVYLERAVAAQKMHRHDEAMENCEHALKVDPTFIDAYVFKARFLLWMSRFEESRDVCRKALAMRRDHAGALNGLGLALVALGKAEEAVPLFQKLIVKTPGEFLYHANLTYALLILGRFDEGFKAYQWRWGLPAFKAGYPAPLWKGEDIKGKILLIHGEHGFGDAIQFCRYVHLATARGIKTIMRVPSPLVRLMKSLKNIGYVIASHEPVPIFERHCSVMDLPAAFHTQPSTIPAHIPYLFADEDDCARWQSRIPKTKDAIKVGLVWGGGAIRTSSDLSFKDQRRYIPPQLMSIMTDIPGFQFYSLQKDEPKAPSHLPIIDMMDECHDFADTAALIMQLDLVISIDTSVAHLAGALGKPVWLLNRYDTCWRWFYDRVDSPWYPTMRIFRQHQPGNWAQVLEDVKQALLKLKP